MIGMKCVEPKNVEAVDPKNVEVEDLMNVEAMDPKNVRISKQWIERISKQRIGRLLVQWTENVREEPKQDFAAIQMNVKHLICTAWLQHLKLCWMRSTYLVID